MNFTNCILFNKQGKKVGIIVLDFINNPLRDPFESICENYALVIYDKPFMMDGALFCHEPVYTENKIKVVHGHTHDLDLYENYFNKEENTTNKKIDPNMYFNVCWDKHHRLLPYNEVLEWLN